MLGTTFFAEQDPVRVAAIKSSDDLDDVPWIGMDELLAIDLEEMLSNTEIKWNDGDPIVYDPDGGLLIIKVNPKALAYVVKQSAKLDEVQLADLMRLAEFIGIHGSSHIYEYATF